MDSAGLLYLLVLPGAVVCSLLVPAVRHLALGLGTVDLPDERRVNRAPTPRLGGVAIFCAFLVVLGVAWALGTELGATVTNVAGVVGFAAGAAIVFVIGVVDDIKGTRPLLKLGGAVTAALVVVVLGGCRVEQVSVPGGSLELGFLAVPLTVLWIVLVTNAMNLMDGLDGLAAGVAAIAFGSILTVAGPERTTSLLAAILLGTCLGFLVHNFHPATIFMGDSGSLFIGYSLGVLSIYGAAKARTGGLTFAPLLLVALPLTDTAWAIGRRYLRGLVPLDWRSHVAGVARVFLPDRQHIHHRLLAAGCSQRQATYVLYAIQTMACAGAIYVVLLWGTTARSARPVAPTPPPAVQSASGPVLP